MSSKSTFFLRQIFVASSPQLAAVSIGGVIGYPNVILEQFQNDNSCIHVDLDIATWIGSTHGLAGIPSIFVPSIMQWKGRKFAFIISCLLIIIGWILTISATNAATIIIAESFHGLGSNSIIIVSFSTISEMVDPKFRIISMSFYAVNQNLGIALVSIIGRYVHWKIVGIIMSVPIIIALVMGCVWPESPSWLAWRGEYAKCAAAFKWLRGTDDDAEKELHALINAQKENCIANKNAKRKTKFKDLWLQITSKDFYIPIFQTFVILCMFYWSGTMVVLIYAMDMIRKATKNEFAAFYGMMLINIIVFIGSLTTTFLLKLFNNKPVLVSSGIASTVCLISVFIVTYLQSIELLSKYSILFVIFIVGFVVSFSLGMTTLSFSVPVELMPVKHRGLGGALYVIFICTLHSSSLKISPYLFLYIGLWGTFLLYSLNTLICVLYIWKYVPETKHRTLQEIENYYNYGYFSNKNRRETFEHMAEQ